MTNHPNRSKRHAVFLVRDSASGITTDRVSDGLTFAQACREAKKAAGRGATFVGTYGPSSCAYVGATITAVISRTCPA